MAMATLIILAALVLAAGLWLVAALAAIDAVRPRAVAVVLTSSACGCSTPIIRFRRGPPHHPDWGASAGEAVLAPRLGRRTGRRRTADGPLRRAG